MLNGKKCIFFKVCMFILSLSLYSHSAIITNGQTVNGITLNEPWFIINNPAGTNTLLIIDNNGDMYIDADTVVDEMPLSGTFTNSLIVKDGVLEIFALNANRAWFAGKVYVQQATLPTENGNDLVIKSSAGTPVAVFDGDDNALYLKGDATHDATASLSSNPHFNVLGVNGATNTGGAYPAGTHEYIVIPSLNFQSGTAYSIEGWFVWDALQKNAQLFSFRKGSAPDYGFTVSASGTTSSLVVRVYKDAATYTTLTIANYIVVAKPTHFAMTVNNSGSFKVYKNGAVVGESAAGSFFNTGTCDVNTIAGGSMTDTDQSFDGYIDAIRIWTDERTQAEIRADMFHSYATLATSDNLLALWDFNHVFGNKLYDSKGTYHGTLAYMKSSDHWNAAGTVRTLTVSAGANGSVSPSGALSVYDRQQYPVVATPDALYEFTTWTVGGSVVGGDANAASTYVELNGGNGSVSANFVLSFNPGIVSNAQFNTDMTSWITQERNGGAQTESVVSGVCEVSVTNTGGDGSRYNNNIMQEYNGTSVLKASTLYNVSLRIKASKSVNFSGIFAGSVSSTTAPTGIISSSNGTATTSWQTFTMTFNNAAAYNYKYFIIGFGGVDQTQPYTVYIDDVSIIEQ